MSNEALVGEESPEAGFFPTRRAGNRILFFKHTEALKDSGDVLQAFTSLHKAARNRSSGALSNSFAMQTSRGIDLLNLRRTGLQRRFAQSRETTRRSEGLTKSASETLQIIPSDKSKGL